MRHINLQALRLPEVAAQLQEKWSSVPELPAAWPADLAERALGLLTRRFMLEVCPKGRPAPTKDCITEGSWSLLRQHAAARRTFFDLGRFRRRLWLQFMVRQWRAAALPRGQLRRQLREEAALLVEV